MLPWSYFLGAHHETTDAGEQLVLSFSDREVLVLGRNLDQLLADIAAYRLEFLRELPDEYSDLSFGDGPVISAISVQTYAGERH